MESTGEVVKTTTGSDGGVMVVRSDAPSDFQIAPRSETINNPPPSPPPATTVAPPPPPPLPTTEQGFSSGPVKKKRGRPRRYEHDGVAVALSPYPISSAAPTSSHVIDFSKRGKVIAPAPSTSFIRTKYQIENLGEWAPLPPPSSGANFTPYIITVNAGEDLTKRIISFSQQGNLAVCVICANGVVSSVTLSQPDSSGGTLTYEGRFEILSLTGSFMPSDSDGTRSRTGGMSVSLASPNGRVLGGSVAGLLVAATPIQVVLGNFLAGGTNLQDEQFKRQNHNFMPSPFSTPMSAPDHRIIRPMPSSLQISTWTPPLATHPPQKPSHDINIALT